MSKKGKEEEEEEEGKKRKENTFEYLVPVSMTQEILIFAF